MSFPSVTPPSALTSRKQPAKFRRNDATYISRSPTRIYQIFQIFPIFSTPFACICVYGTDLPGKFNFLWAGLGETCVRSHQRGKQLFSKLFFAAKYLARHHQYEIVPFTISGISVMTRKIKYNVIMCWGHTTHTRHVRVVNYKLLLCVYYHALCVVFVKICRSSTAGNISGPYIII